MTRNITQADVRQLEEHARCSGGFELAEQCVAAVSGDNSAFERCAKLLRDGALREVHK